MWFSKKAGGATHHHGNRLRTRHTLCQSSRDHIAQLGVWWIKGPDVLTDGGQRTALITALTARSAACDVFERSVLQKRAVLTPPDALRAEHTVIQVFGN